MANIIMYQGDTLPAYTKQLLDENGAIINVTGATIVVKLVATSGSLSGTITTGAGTVNVTNAALGQVSYAWNATDTATVGTFNFWFLVTMAGGAKEHSVGPDSLQVVTAP